jgi:hypothetical protein
MNPYGLDSLLYAHGAQRAICHGKRTRYDVLWTEWAETLALHSEIVLNKDI